MNLWTPLLDVLILLVAALVLGGIFDRLKQSPLLGYLLAGTLLGPNAFNLLLSHTTVETIAELGVTLLLFTIGLEFSWRKLRSVGPVALGGGTLQVLSTGILTATACLLFGLPATASVGIGTMIALSSTAAVIRLLSNRSELDTVYGRDSLGILLLQDIAVVPVMLLIAVMSGGNGPAEVWWAIGRAVLMGVLLVGGLHVFLNRILPRLLSARAAARNRDVPILLAIATAVGSAWVSHAVGFSPILGAFLAGMLLAESPFATQIRADIVPLRTLFVTLFFSSIGMLSNPAWVADNWILLAGTVTAVVICKTAITAAVVRMFRRPLGLALATGLVLAQVGEFSLVAASAARMGGVIDTHLFNLIVAVMIVTLFLTPYLIASAPRLATFVGKHSAPCKDVTRAQKTERAGPPLSDHVVIIGFGPAGQCVAEELMRATDRKIVVGELNPHTAEAAAAYELATYLGDATRGEILARLHIDTAAVVVITLPDPTAARLVVQRVRGLAPQAYIIARARYHVHRWQLNIAGAHAVVDEEEQVGRSIAEQALQRLAGLDADSGGKHPED